jgi:hypothetical protein
VAFGLSGQAAEPINASTMPWVNEVDLRVTKGLRLGGMQWTAYADFRNLLNLTTITNLFAETGDVFNETYKDIYINPERDRLETEAGAFLQVVDGEQRIALPDNCGLWGGGPTNCVLIKQAEARFGNGDGFYTETEYMSAFNAEYNVFNAPYTSYQAGRWVRLGLELRF